MRDLPRILRSYEKCVNLFRPGNILFATDGRNALTGYNRPARQPPANFAELSCGQLPLGTNKSAEFRERTPAKKIAEVISNDST